MYCKNCGKFIGEGESLCDECANLNRVNLVQNNDGADLFDDLDDYSTTNPIEISNATASQTQEYSAKRVGLVKGIISIALGSFASSAISSTFSSLVNNAKHLIANFIETQQKIALELGSKITCILYMILAFCASIASIVLGALAIKDFKATADCKTPKRTVALVLSIVGIVISASAILMTVIFAAIFGICFE